MNDRIMSMEALKKHWKIVLIIGILAPISVGITINVFLPIIRPDKRPIHKSEFTIDQYGAKYTSAKWEYEIQHKKKYFFDNFFGSKLSWAYFDMDVRDIENSFNLSDCERISFYIKGSHENIPLEFNLFTREFGEEHKVYQYSTYFSVSTIWQKKEITFMDLTITPWTQRSYPSAPKKPAMEKVYAIGFAAKTSNYRHEVIFVDEIGLIDKNGNKNVITDFATPNISIRGIDGVWFTGTGHH